MPFFPGGAPSPGIGDGGSNQGGGQAGGSSGANGSPRISVWQQCGGLGGGCAAHGSCADAPFPGQACADGNTCQRVNEWHWQCSPSDRAVSCWAPGSSAAVWAAPAPATFA
jgi:hypothetical protein